jgi:hypothetical protein
VFSETDDLMLVGLIVTVESTFVCEIGECGNERIVQWIRAIYEGMVPRSHVSKLRC